MHTILQRVSITGAAIALVVSMVAAMVPINTSAAEGVFDFTRVSPDSWGLPRGETGDMITGTVTDTVVFNGDIWVMGDVFNNTTYSRDSVLWNYNLNGDKSWSMVLPPTDFSNGVQRIVAITVLGNKLYVTINNSDTDTPSLWAYDGSTWSQDSSISSLGFEEINDVAAYKGGLCLIAYDGSLLAYCNNTGTWINTNIDNVNIQDTGAYRGRLVEANGQLYLNTTSGIWEYRDNSWGQMSTPFTGGDNDWEVTSMTAGSDNSLVVSMIDYRTVQVYQYKGTTWTKLGDTNFDLGESAAYFEPSVTTYKGKIVVGTGNYDEGATVFEWDGTAWNRRSADYLGSTKNPMGYNPDTVRTMTATADQLFVSTSATGEGDYFARIWATTLESSSAGPDGDTDGISDTLEANAPNGGDANNDGIADNTQANVASFVNSVSGKYAVVAMSDTCELTSASVAAENSNAKDMGYNYQTGLVNFSANCSTGSAQVKIYHYGVAADKLILRKHNPATKSYFTINDATIETQVIGGQTVAVATYTITDNGVLDLDPAVGKITDPVGLANVAVGVPNTGLVNKN